MPRYPQPRTLRVALFLLLTLCWQAALAANDRSLLWKVQSGQATVYLYGSIHLATEDFYPLRAAATEAFKASDTLVVEVDLTVQEPAEIQQWMQRHGLYPDGETLQDHLSPATWQQLAAFAQSNDLSLPQLAQQKPGLLAVTLAMAQIMKMGLQPELGLDLHFMQAARGNKKILALETLEEQLSALLDFPADDLVVAQTLTQLETLHEVMQQIIDAWKRGDEQQLAALMIEDDLDDHPEFKPIYERLITQRNQRMAASIAGFLRQPGSYFVVVGAGHLVGEGSIVDLLEREGFTVRRQ